MTGTAPLVTCPVCRGSVALNQSGALRRHYDHAHPLWGAGNTHRSVPICRGSGTPGGAAVRPTQKETAR